MSPFFLKKKLLTPSFFLKKLLVPHFSAPKTKLYTVRKATLCIYCTITQYPCLNAIPKMFMLPGGPKNRNVILNVNR